MGKCTLTHLPFIYGLQALISAGDTCDESKQRFKEQAHHLLTKSSDSWISQMCDLVPVARGKRRHKRIKEQI